MPTTSPGPGHAAGPPSPRDRALRWLPVGVWMCVIFAMSSVPGSRLPGGYSLQGHFGEYAVLGSLVVLALRHRSPRPAWALVALAACSLYAVTDELHQALVPGRTPDVLDWATDTVGAAAGVAVTAALLAWRSRARPPADPGGAAS